MQSQIPPSSPLPTGAATSALQSAEAVLVGAVTETAPASDTASSGLNGRLQRIAQRITSFLALIPAALTGSGNFKVAVVESTASQAVTIAAQATAIAKAEDVASADADVGVPAMAVRKATPANTSGTDGDYEMLQMSAGRLWVDASGQSLTVGIHGVTQSGTWTVQAAQSGTWTVNSISSVVQIADNSGSLTVDAPVGTPVFVRLSDGTSAISTLPVSLASVPTHAVTQSGTWTVTADTEMPAAAFLSDASAIPTTPMVGAVGMTYNGATLDPLRGTVEGTALASAVRTATTNSADITNHNCRGVLLYINNTVIGASSTLQFLIQGKDPVSGNYITIHAAPAVYNATGTYGQSCSPGDSGASGAAANYTIAHFPAQLPRTWRVQVVHSNANSCTYSVGYCLLP